MWGNDYTIEHDSARTINERTFEAAVLHYITEQQDYRFGGVANLFATVAKTLHDLAEKTRCADYETAGDLCDEITEKTDLPYYCEDAA